MMFGMSEFEIINLIDEEIAITLRTNYVLNVIRFELFDLIFRFLLTSVPFTLFTKAKADIK